MNNKIWYICKYASPIQYFFGTRHFYLAEEWVKNGNEVCIFTSNSSHLTDNLPSFKGKYKTEIINGVYTYWINTFKYKKASSFNRFISWFHFDILLLLMNKKKIIKPNIIIVSSLSLTTVIPAWILAKKYRAKFIFEVRDIWPLSAIVLGGFSKFNPIIYLFSKIEKFGYNSANLIVGTMPNLSEHIRNITNKNVKCVCVPQGLNLNFYYFKQENISIEYFNKWLPVNKFIICYCGTINANNPLLTFIDAAKMLSNNSKFHFIILGSGTHKLKLVELAKDLKNVSFPPALPKNQIYSFLKNVDVCYDSFESSLALYGVSRNKWIDYMYAEKPIICSLNGFHSMINESNCGEFIPYNNSEKLVQCIERFQNMDKDEIIRIGQNGKQYLIENRTFDLLSIKYLDYIKAS